MPILLLALVALASIGLGLAWFLRAKPTVVAKRARLLLVLLGAIGIGGLLLFGVRFLPSVLPELFGLGGVLVTAAVARALRQRPTGGFSTPGKGQRTDVRTECLEAWIDHVTGDVGGRVVRGKYAGRLLEVLNERELLDLRSECTGEPESLNVLEAYLDRRMGADWRNARQSPPAGPRGEMSRAEALAILGLAEGASAEDIKSTHRRLIQRVHPDVGGSADLAARINRAKDVLLVV